MKLLKGDKHHRFNNSVGVIFLTGDEFVGSVPVGDLSEVSQDACGFLGLRLQIGRDGVTHCRRANDELP